MNKKQKVRSRVMIAVFSIALLAAMGANVVRVNIKGKDNSSADAAIFKSQDDIVESTDNNEKASEDEQKRLLEQYDYKNYSSIYVLVNKDNILPEGYAPTDLQEVNAPLVNKAVKMRSEAKEKLEELMEETKKENLSMLLSSGYRNSDEQEVLYSQEVISRGEGGAYVAPPGSSEHQTGLAIDITSNKVGCKLEEVFETTDEWKWLNENAYKYGFILRYPKGKEEITGYQYEPWHFRYVGVELATILYNRNITLEEYYQGL